MIGGSGGKVMVETVVWEDGGGDATEESGRSGSIRTLSRECENGKLKSKLAHSS